MASPDIDAIRYRVDEIETEAYMVGAIPCDHNESSTEYMQKQISSLTEMVQGLCSVLNDLTRVVDNREDS